MINEIKTKLDEFRKLENELEELEGSIENHITEFVKNEGNCDYHCFIFLGGEPDNNVTEIIYDKVYKNVMVIFSDHSCGLDELDIYDKMTILEAISTE